MFIHRRGLVILFSFFIILSSLGFINYFDGTELMVSAASTIYVGSNVTYKKIQDAIDNANPGDEIIVFNGTYYEDLVIEKKITLQGINSENTVINGTGTGHTIHITTNDVIISGFTITGSSHEWGSAGVLLESVQGCRINNNIVIKNGYFGIRILLSENIRVDNNSISDNSIAGVGLELSQSNSVENNDLSPNNLVGISVSRSHINYITGNNISKSQEIGIDVVDSNENHFNNNDISLNPGNAIEFWNSHSNFFINNIVTKNQEDGIHLQSSQNNTFKNNKLTENGFSIAGFWVNDWDSHNIDSSNTVNGKPVYYWENEGGGSVPTDAGQVILANCSSVYVESQTINETSEGIILGFSNYCKIRINKVTFNRRNGISLWKSDNNLIEENEITSNQAIGISCIYSNGNTISKNTISKNKHGIELRAARNHKLRNNTLNNNGILISGNLFDFWRVEYTDKLLDSQGRVLWAYSKSYWNSHTIENSNTANGKPVYYWKNRDKGTIPTGAGQIILANCSNVIVQDQNLGSVSIGIAVGFSNNNIIRNNMVTSNIWQGLYLESSSYNEINNNSFSMNNKNGILLDFSNYNIISFNTIDLNAENGIFLYFSNNNTILNNSVTNNNGGHLFEFSNDNKITKNSLKWNKEFGQYFDAESTKNIIFHNNFIENFNQATDYGGNQWNLEYPGGGNYWSDYFGLDNFSGPDQNLSGDDGFGDVPYYMIVSWMDVQDMYPFITPVTQRFDKPSIPRNFSTHSGDGYVLLKWSAPVSDGGTPVISYVIYRSEGSGPKSVIATVQDAFSYNDTDVTNDVTYHYVISALNAEGSGPNSTEVSAKPTIKPIINGGNGKDDGGSSIFLYVGILIILIWVVTILITLLGMRRKSQKVSKEKDKEQVKKPQEKPKKD